MSEPVVFDIGQQVRVVGATHVHRGAVGVVEQSHRSPDAEADDVPDFYNLILVGDGDEKVYVSVPAADLEAVDDG